MDFIDLANGLNEVTATLLRHLTASGSEETTAGDDDFARIDGEKESASSSSSSSSSPQDSSYYYYSPEDSSSTASTTVNRPFLSPTAEAELYLLATNFLLCKFQSSASFFACLFCHCFLFFGVNIAPRDKERHFFVIFWV